MSLNAGVIVCALGGGVVLILTIHEVRTLRRLRRAGVRTPGTVIRHVTVDEVRAPVIEFFDNTGRRHEFTPKIRGGGLHPPIGATLPVAYFDGDPASALVFNKRFILSSVLLGGLAGAFFLGLAVWIMFQPPS
ncbi:DUF3592 domain-containing protein [Nonomuraea sp. NPDC004297]